MFFFLIFFLSFFITEWLLRNQLCDRLKGSVASRKRFLIKGNENLAWRRCLVTDEFQYVRCYLSPRTHSHPMISWLDPFSLTLCLKTTTEPRGSRDTTCQFSFSIFSTITLSHIEEREGFFSSFWKVLHQYFFQKNLSILYYFLVMDFHFLQKR